MTLPRFASLQWMLFLALAMTAGVRAADAPPAPPCYVLDKIDTQADHGDADSAAFKQNYSVTANADGSITWTRIGKGMRNEGCVIQVWPREGRATYTQSPAQAKGSGTMTWTPWPDGMCPGDTFALSIHATATGNATFGGNYNPWQMTTTPINPASSDPMIGIYANNGEASGNTTAQLTPANGEAFVAPVRFGDDGYAVELHYHYRPLKPGEKMPPKADPPGTCTKTFGKTWPATDWGVMAFTLDGDKATGTYTNRGGKFGAGTITGTVAGNVLEGTWADAGGKGTLKIVLSDTGCAFSGRFVTDGGSSTGEPIGGTAHRPGTDGPIPPIVTPPTGAIDLTGYWKSDTGALYYLRQMGTKLYWNMDAMPSARNIFMGDITADTITGTWVDLPGGVTETGTGTLKIKIESNDKLTKISDTMPYAAGAWMRISKPAISGTGTDTTNTTTVGAEPWNTPAGRACMDAWITKAMAKLNAYDGGKSFNDRKPWGIDAKYGTLIGTGLSSALSPDEFGKYQYNRYWWIWDHYVTNADGTWDRDEWNKAGVPDLHADVAKCK